MIALFYSRPMLRAHILNSYILNQNQAFIQLPIMSIIRHKTSNANNDSLRKTNSKLPKLTVQQQLDNQQVIERMNRKITFTKNQRHLGKTMAYNEALQLQQTSNYSGIFSVEPAQVLFTDYKLLTNYEAEIKFINKSKLTQRIKITPMKKKQFVISKVKYPNQNTGDIAPGMGVTIAVRFRPNNLHDNEDQLIVIVGDGVIRVPLFARRQKCKGQWPDQIECGHCWVGDEISKAVNIRNRGGESTYRLQTKLQEHQIFRSGPFTIEPRVLNVKNNSEENQIKVLFKPEKAGYFQEQIVFKSDQGEEEEIKIKVQGGAYTAHLTLDEINGHKVKQQKFQNILFINNCEPGKKSVENFKIQNHAVVPVDYFWYFEDDSHQIQISKKSGKISASEILNFQVTYTPASNAPKIIPINLYLYNLPEQSLETNSSVKVIDGIKSIQCFEILVRTNSRESAIQVTPLHSKIIDELYLGHRKTGKFKVINQSEVSRIFSVDFVEKSKEWNVYCQHFLTQDEKEDGITKNICVDPKSSIQIEVEFEPTQLTRKTLYAYLLVTFDNAPARMVSFEGEVQHPNLQLLTSHIDFNLVRVRSEFRKKIKIFNKGENEVRFKIENPHRFYQLDFYDLYDFEDQNYFLNRLKIVSEQDQECRDWSVVPPQSQIQLEFQLCTSEEESIELLLDLIIQDGPTYPIKISAQVQELSGNMTRNTMNLKQIYKGNIYNSNKFLSRQFAVMNTGNLDFSYEIIPQVVEQCNITFSKMKQIVVAQKKQRIDVVLDPIKTGPFSIDYEFRFYDDVPVYPSKYSQLADIIEIVPENRKNVAFSKFLKIQSQVRGVQICYYLKDQSKAKKVRQKIEQPIGSVKLSSHSYKSGSRSHYLEADKLVYPFLEEINFYNCQINKVRQMEIIIQNDSGLTTEYQIYAQKFHSDIKDVPQSRGSQRGLVNTDQEAFTSDMGKTYLQNRVLDKAQKIHLSNNKGISIMCEPSSGQLHKKQQQKIVITMFNDTSGKFKDNLVISVKDHEVKKFPINMQIKGTPVSLSRNQLGINFNEETPLMNTGTFFVKNGKSTRNIKIINNGPKQVRLRWLFYNYGEVDQSKDFFNISFAEAESGSGNLVEAKWDSIKPSLCQNPPFSIHPSEKIMKGRQQFAFTLTIHDNQKLGKFQNLLIGEPFMIEGDSTRQMECLAVVLQGETVRPILTLDQKHKNHIQKLQKFAQTGNEERTTVNNSHRKIKLKNQNRSNLSFTVDLITANSQFQNFQFVSVETDSPLDKLKAPPTRAINSSTLHKLSSIRPSSSKLQMTKLETQFMQKQFTLPYESYVEVGIDLVANIENKGDWPLEEKIRKDGILRILYSNGDFQEINLVGWLYRPFIHIEMPNSIEYSNENKVIDFGVVHVKNSKKISIYISNPSKSAADWNIHYVKYHQSKPFVFEKQLWTDEDYEDQTITDEKKCFRLSQDSGHLLAQSIPIHYMPTTLALNGQDDKYAEGHKPTKIDFLFKPDSNILYKSKFILTVKDGLSYPIIVKGLGTFEEEKEVK